jgi:succinoglycan biosynthesis transport protein ExoP
MLWTHRAENAADKATAADRFQLTARDSDSISPSGTPSRLPDIQFYQLVGILRRRSRLILSIAAIGTTLTAVVGLLIPPRYTAKAQILVEPQQAIVGAQAADVRQIDDSAIDTHLTTIMSRDHLQQVLLSLSKDPQFRPAASGADTDPGATATTIPGDAGSPSPTAQQGALDATASDVASSGPYELVRRLSVWGSLMKSGQGMTLSFDELERRLMVNQERRSRVITVSFTSTSPVKAASVANRTAQLYVENQTKQKQAYLSQELARVGERFSERKSEVQSAGEAAQTVIQQRFGGLAANGEGPKVDERMRELLRAAAASVQLQDSLLRRQKEIRDQQENVKVDVSMLSFAAPPDRPSSPNPLFFILPALTLFLVCASLLAVVMERLDRGLRSERDVEDALGISCMGLVPRLPRSGTTRPHQHLLMKPFTSYTESIRSIAAALQLVVPDRAPKLIVISSSVQGEGKTTLAVSLAVYAAILKRRVLLVDLDFRHPSMLREFDGKCRAPERDVFDLILDNRLPADAVQRIPELGLDCLPMACCLVDPLTLFDGERLPRLLHQLCESYDCVFIDGPPLLGVTEARLLASLADKVLFVVKWGSTRRELAQSAANLLRGSPSFDTRCVDLTSAVVTQVDLKKHARYRYGDVAESLVRYQKHDSQSQSTKADGCAPDSTRGVG